MIFLIVHKGRSGIHVLDIRTFAEDQEKKARKYYESLVGDAHWHQVYGYRTSDNAQPKLIWSMAKDKSLKKPLESK